MTTPGGHNGSILALAISPNGKILASGSEDTTIKLWNLPEGTLIKMLETHNEVAALAISPDGKLLASGVGNNIMLWSFPEGNLIRTLRGSWIEYVDISPNGKLLVSRGRTEDRYVTITLWSLPEGDRIKMIKGDYLAISPDGTLLVTGGTDKTIKLWNLPEGTFNKCLFDLQAIPASAKETTYQQTDIYGQVITYTLPCGSPIPPGAVCTSNCVPGTYIAPPPKRSSSGGSYCTCNKVCTCIPVCQAHRLNHPDAIVRVMAEEILYLMGGREFKYMRWAADNAKPALQSRIFDLIARIRQGEKPNPSCWPSADECSQRLAHPDEIIRIMAAQMLNLHNARGLPLCTDIQGQVTHWLNEAAQRPWFVRYNVKNTIAQSHPLSRA